VLRNRASSLINSRLQLDTLVSTELIHRTKDHEQCTDLFKRRWLAMQYLFLADGDAIPNMVESTQQVQSVQIGPLAATKTVQQRRAAAFCPDDGETSSTRAAVPRARWC
jgi:hypothetical protein